MACACCVEAYSVPDADTAAHVLTLSNTKDNVFQHIDEIKSSKELNVLT